MNQIKMYSPRDELRPFVRYYWELHSGAQQEVLTFPIGCPQIIFHKKSPLFIPELQCHQSRLTVSGQVNFPAHVATVGETDMLVAVFYPHTLGLFIDTSPADFYNREVSGYDISCVGLHDVSYRIYDSRDTKADIAAVESWLMSRLKDPTLDMRRTGAALHLLMSGRTYSVGRMASEACLSKKQFERVFRHCVGMNPKEYAGIVRFQRALWLMQLGRRDFASVAYECGYSDQSHFGREFKRYSGYSPAGLLRVARPYSDLFAI